jgi:hypothetical protein
MWGSAAAWRVEWHSPAAGAVEKGGGRLAFYWESEQVKSAPRKPQALNLMKPTWAPPRYSEKARASGLYELKLSQLCVHLCVCTKCWLVPWTTINPKFYLNQSVHVHVKTWLFTLTWHSSFYLNQSIFMSKSSCLPSHDIYRCDTGDHVEYISCIYWHIYMAEYRHRCMQIQKWNMQHVREWHWHCSTQFQGWTVSHPVF